jgi:hypothetical protein
MLRVKEESKSNNNNSKKKKKDLEQQRGYLAKNEKNKTKKPPKLNKKTP